MRNEQQRWGRGGGERIWGGRIGSVEERFWFEVLI
jgi:hypothetical protein